MAEQIIQRDVQMSAANGKLSFEEFLREYDGMHAEWLDGEVILMSPVSLQHQDLLIFLCMLLKVFLERRPLGKVLIAPITMRILGKRHGREPDLMLVKTEHFDRLHRNFVDGPADIVVELVSPESDERDHGTKFTEYEAAGVPEYWLIDLLRKEVYFYHLNVIKNDEGADELRYRRMEVDTHGDIRSIELPGFRLHVETLWQDTLPTVVEMIEIVRKMLEMS